MAEWTTAYINQLPDSAFLYIAPGGTKDEEGKTVPRSLRFFPVKDADGKVDVAHLRNALARIPQAKIPQAAKDAARKKAEDLAKEHLETYQEEALMPLHVTEILESKDTGSAVNRYRVQLLELDKVGKGGNRRVYPRGMFSKHFQKYEGAQAFLDHSYDKVKGRSVRDLVGYYENVDANGGADLVVINHRDLIHPLIEEQQRSGKELIGLSHHILGRQRPERRGGGLVNVVEEIATVKSVDLVTTPAAGGRVSEILEQEEVEVKNLEELKEAHPELLEEFREEIVEELREELRNEVESKVYGSKASQEKAKKELEKRFTDLQEAIQSRDAEIAQLVKDRENARREQLITEAVAKSGLPASASTRVAIMLEEEYESEEKLVEAVDAAIKSEKQYLASIRESGRSSRSGGSRDSTTIMLEEARSALRGLLGNEEENKGEKKEE